MEETKRFSENRPVITHTVNRYRIQSIISPNLFRSGEFLVSTKEGPVEYVNATQFYRSNSIHELLIVVG